MEDAHPQPERRSQARYAVDTGVSVIVVNQGCALSGRMFELSLDGCRVRTGGECFPGGPAGVEVMFRINGIGFRLAGTMQWLDARQTAGIRFSPMPSRRCAALEELLAELDAEEKARAAAEAQSTDQAEQPATAQIAVPDKATTPDRERQSPIPISRTSSPKSAEARPTMQPARPIRERRAEARHPVDTGASVFFIDVRAKIQGRILDLSMSGCRLRTAGPFPVGIYRRVEAEFNVDGLPFRLAGVVQALHDRFTVGIRFLDMSARKRNQLAQLMDEIEESSSRSAAHEEQSPSPIPRSLTPDR